MSPAIFNVMQNYFKPFALLLLPFGIIGLSGCSVIFDDPIQELDPNLLLASELDPEDKPRIIRKSILESFGNFGCVSCPEAEHILAQYLHGDNSENIEVDTNLIIVNYHSDFSSPLKDPWETTTVENVAKLYGFTSLPQIVLNGNNSQYGFSEKDVDFKSEYHPLIQSQHMKLETITLKLSLNLQSLEYRFSRIFFELRIENWNADALENFSLKILAVKNRPVFAPYPGLQSVAWEVIVVEVLTIDMEGNELFIPKLDGLSSTSFDILFELPDETEKHLTLPENGIEGIENYAIIVVATDANGLVQNVLAYQYDPVE